ncbi:MAG: xanthine dehydrogenase family protein molybdopterin-binding subunit [Candidatus Velthaea sp.]
MADMTLNRRDLLKAGGALIVSFSLAGSVAPRAARAGTIKSEAIDDVDAFLAIQPDGKVMVYSGKVDLGTGVRTAMTQIAAEELSVPFERVEVIQGDTGLTPDQGTSAGSLSIQIGGMQIRQAAATARQALMHSAAERLAVKADDLSIADGVIRSKSSGKQVAYAELLGGNGFGLKLDKDAPLKPPAEYTIVGKPVARLDIPGKVTGTFTYMQDVKVPGMLHGRVIHPAGDGATLLSVDESSVRGIPGVVKVVHDGNFVGVVAKTEWAAIKAARKLKVKWSAWDGLPVQHDLWAHVRATKIVKEEVTSNTGDVATALQHSTRRMKATYDFAIHTHGSIGPSAAIADYSGKKLTVWTASQGAHALRSQLAQMFSLPDADVRCIYADGAGCYGRNGHEDAASDAALLSRAVERPVRVQWMRADEHGWDPKGPPTLIDLEAGLDASGAVSAWRGEFFIPQGVSGATFLLTADLAKLPADVQYHPGNVFKNSDIPYAFPNVSTVCHRLESTPFRPSWIRSPGRMQNTFANESFLDELIAAANADPLDYRLKNLKPDPRATEVLQRLGRLANWQTGKAGSRGQGKIMRGRGVSYLRYDGDRTYVGAIADVEVDRATGKVRVTHVAVAQDTGQIINPDGMRNQIEGNVVQTVSRTLVEEVKFNRSRVTSLDWASYPILKFPDVPEVSIDLIDRPTIKPWGGGEPSAAAIPAAVANAIFDATGVRLRSIPITAAKVKVALA